MHDCIIYMLQNRRFVVANYERVFPKQYHMTVDTFLHQALHFIPKTCRSRVCLVATL